MSLRRFLAPWTGDLLRHRPRGSTRSVVDDRYLGQSATNRWSALGVRAYDFARDPGVVAAEHARHLAAELPTGATERIAREVFQLHASLDRVLDLTDPRVIEAMGAEALERWILDIRRTQAASSYLLTHIPGLQGLIVPSVAFLDDLSWSNVVVFRDAIDPAEAFGPPRHVMDIILAGTGSDAPGER